MPSGKEDSGRERLMWIVGASAATAFVVYQMNKYLKEKDQLAELKAYEKLKAGLPELAEG